MRVGMKNFKIKDQCWRFCSFGYSDRVTRLFLHNKGYVLLMGLIKSCGKCRVSIGISLWVDVTDFLPIYIV